MKTLKAIADLFNARVAQDKLEKRELARRAGVSPKTLYQVLGGQADYKVTTLLAMADRLGLELVLLPKDAVHGLEATMLPADIPTTLVNAAHGQVRKSGDDR